MTFFVPDSNPGRCLNYRTGRDANGYAASKRCLDYEGHQSACRFLPDPEIRSASQGIYVSKPPGPWVSPLDAEGI
jgi:hypothetical protein